jgi:hypothetical protein
MIRSLINFTLHGMSLGRDELGEMGWAENTARIGETKMCRKLSWENLKVNTYADGRIILRWKF